MRLPAGATVPGVLLSAVVGILAGASGSTAVHSQALSYLSNDPRSCVNCHIMREQYDGWSKGSHHAAATCNDCHAPDAFLAKYWSKAENGFWHSKGFTLQDFPEPVRIRPHNRDVVNAACRRCHQELVDPLHPAGLNCVRCHESAGHGPPR